MLPLPLVQAENASTKKTTILTWDATTEATATLQHNGSLSVGGRVYKSRSEGDKSGPGDFSIVDDPTSSGGKVLHYFCGSQSDGHKARTEHYLHIEPMNTTFYSEFSIKLDPEFTKVDTKRPDNGPNWCCVRQWHQGVPVSPPLALTVKSETNNVLVWSIITGDKTGHNQRHQNLGEKQIELGHWYHYRVKWKFSPDENGECTVMMSDTKLPKDLTDNDILFSYKGPIGYKVDGWNDPAVPIDGTTHAPNTVREQQGIYQGPHVDPATHHGFSVDNIAIYQ